MPKLLLTTAVALVPFWPGPGTATPTASTAATASTGAAAAAASTAAADATASSTIESTSTTHDSWSVQVPGDPAVTAEHVTVRLWPDITVVGASDDERAAVDLAVRRFRDAGLALPDVTIEFRDDQAECGGHLGLFQTRFTPWRILVCSDAPFVVTHELAHAWEVANLDDADRAAYVEHRGLETWDSSEAGWGERGVEDAAFHVQQNLMPRHVDLDSPAWQERTDAYAVLTGAPSPMLSAAHASAADRDPSSTGWR